LFVAPFTVLIPPNNRYNLSILNIPQDDTNTMFYFIAWSEGEGIDQDDWRRFGKAQVGVDLDTNFHRIRTRANNYLQDREAMKRDSHTGIEGIPNQDIAMWETMGPIADRSRERLGASDVAIVQFRRIMVDAACKVRDGGAAIGTTADRTPVAKHSRRSSRTASTSASRRESWACFPRSRRARRFASSAPKPPARPICTGTFPRPRPSRRSRTRRARRSPIRPTARRRTVS